MTMVVRAGNPRDIHDWADLMQPGLEVVTPNPATEGSGRTALLAAYAAGRNGGADPEAGRDYVRRLILEHIVLGPTSVWEARENFLDGRGDVLLLSEAAQRLLVLRAELAAHVHVQAAGRGAEQLQRITHKPFRVVELSELPVPMERVAELAIGPRDL